mmetsp:Transcript_3000/g.4638  ORF Transcript_3000/g.4638 Transcript_3000/m.4638 type:complete len:112 (+) Transcript_3000:1418-1753(+)|eukprot:CAMPEP_0170505550 /NCGR_PEP_ID=MMETSP0208-20121228/51309_1 /TAXON_ID=197538 /ORGANISM="Strombidium inclinatum, Strain S3" /LENGTH=111 /DNA_ID=CAMNT_0010786493 /DNA_START=1348 /DNA_END=1683 /DNA_ORIENTATION=+
MSLLFKKGKKLLHEDLSIEKLIKTLRDIKIFMKKHWLDDRRRFEIQHDPRNVIDLDDLNDYLYNEPESDTSEGSDFANLSSSITSQKKSKPSSSQFSKLADTTSTNHKLPP